MTKFDLENFLIKKSQQEDVPKFVLDKLSRDGYPEAIGHTEKTGWYILSSGGQGPCIDWMENEEERSRILKKSNY